MTFKIGDIVKFDYGIAYYGIVVECRGGMVCVQWFDATEAHFYPMYDIEKVSQ
jgi:uncharacterized protein YodC (DUF2158 family)